MLAGYLIEPSRIELRDIPVPTPGPGEIVVRIRAALTDGTDLKAYRRGHPQMPMPTRFGHEFSGDVAAAGSAVDRFAVGDAVMSVHSAPCGACFWCRHDEHELCAHVMETKLLGAYAQYVLVPAHVVRENAYPKPSSLAYEAAAFLEPLACVTHALRKLSPAADATIAIIGDGGFGLLHALVVRACGFGTPVIVGRRESRLALAERYGIAVIDARELSPGRLMEMLQAQTGGRGADVVVETTGTQAVWEAAPSYARRGGLVVLFGGLPSGTHVRFDASRLHYDELTVMSPFHLTPRSVREARDLLVDERIDVLPLITERLPLDSLSEAFARLDRGDGMKFAIVP